MVRTFITTTINIMMWDQELNRNWDMINRSQAGSWLHHQLTQSKQIKSKTRSKVYIHSFIT